MNADRLAIFRKRIMDLEAFGNRGSASAFERRAADYLSGQLASIGLDPIAESFHGSPTLALRLLAPALVAFAGALLLWWQPMITAAAGAIALISLIAEHTTRVVLLSWPFTRSPSQNIYARVPAADRLNVRIILSAHYDTQHAGWVHAINRVLIPMSRHTPLALKTPMLPVIGFMAGQVVLGAVAASAGNSTTATIAGVLLLAAYAILAALLLQWAFSPAVPGASDNASGVAAVLELAEEWRRHPIPDVELVVLFPGCEESGLLGAAAWADRHRDEIRAVPTLFLNLDSPGFGPPRILAAEVPIAGLPVRAPQWIVDLCSETARSLGADPTPHSLPGPTDGLAFLARGIPGISLVGFRDGIVLPHYHTMQDTSANLDFVSAQAGVKFADAVLAALARSGGQMEKTQTVTDSGSSALCDTA